MSDSLSLPKVKLTSPERRKLYYEEILSGTPPSNNNNKNKLKNIQIKNKNSTTKKSINLNIDNMQTTEAICNIIDLINDNNLNIFYKDDNSNFKRNIDQLNLKFYLETEKIISANQNKSKEENYSFNSNKLFLILFKQINLYIKEIERLNALMINSVKDTDNMKKKMAIFIRKQNDFETKEQLIQTLKYSVSSLEKKLSNILISENNLRKEMQKLKKEKDYYYEYYKSNTSANNKNSNNQINKSQNINDLKQNYIANNQQMNNTKDNFFKNSKDIIILGEIQNNNNILKNDHKRNNSENDNPFNNNNKMPASIQKYYKASPKRKMQNTLIKNNNNCNNNNISGRKSIIRLCNYYSHNIEIDIPLGFKSKSPGKLFHSNKIKGIHFIKDKKFDGRASFQKSSILNEKKLDLNIVNNNNNTFIFDNSLINRNQTIYNTINQYKDLNINRLFKTKTNIDKLNFKEEGKPKNQKIIINKDLNIKELDADISFLNNLENLIIEVKDHLIVNENKNNNKANNIKNKIILKNKTNCIQNSNYGKKNNNSNNTNNKIV